MKSTLPAFCLVVLITVCSLNGHGQGVTTPSFGASAVTESFEGIATSSSNYQVGAANGGRTVPVTPFTFASGVVLTQPDPNAEFKVELQDNNKGFVAFNICPSEISSADIPDGTACLTAWGATSMTFTLPVLAQKVGMYVEGASSCISSATITLTAYNAANEVIGTFTTEATGSASNWKNHFIGYNSTTDGIAKITLTGTALVIDKLTFEKPQECLATPAFGASAVTESFEGIPTAANNPLKYQGYGLTEPVMPFTFGSGVTLTGPGPNTGQVQVGDWSKGTSPTYFCSGAVVSAADVPDGTAFLRVMDETSALTFTLPAGSRKVGMYVEGPAGCISSTPITLTAYNAANAVIASCTASATNDGTNWKNHFLGVQSPYDQIVKITVSGPYIIIDKLIFEPLPCDQKTWYLDADNDGYYVGTGITSCLSPGTGFRSTGILGGEDCDDTNAQIKPGTVWYLDVDNDGYYNGTGVVSCSSPGTGYRETGILGGGDCDNVNALINPTTVWYLDNDNDGYYTGSGVTSCASPGQGYRYTGLLGGNDCDDLAASVWQSKDLYIDDDGDGYDNGTTTLCYGATLPQGYISTTLGSDCNDLDPNINPATVWYLDYDNDGYYTGTGITQCASPGIGYRTNGLSGGGDCGDGDGFVHPGAVEICNDGIDNNCDGTIDDGCIVKNDLSINDVSMNEGDKGRASMTFTVTLSKASNTKVTVQYRTLNGTATAGSDYAAKSGAITFRPGTTTQKLAIPVIGDKSLEANESFSVVLSNPTNAVLFKSIGTGTILNDDGLITTTTQAMKASTATEEIQGKLKVIVAPNPSYTHFTLQMQSGSDKPLVVRTFNTLGRLVEAKSNVPANGTLMLGGTYRPGVYFTEVTQGNTRVTLKLIKQGN